jgi:hypothetical protein
MFQPPRRLKQQRIGGADHAKRPREVVSGDRGPVGLSGEGNVSTGISLE